MPGNIHNRRVDDYCIGNFECEIVMKCDFESSTVLWMGIHGIVRGFTGSVSVDRVHVYIVLRL
jgi:hypothetical protein